MEGALVCWVLYGVAAAEQIGDAFPMQFGPIGLRLLWLPAS